MPIYLPQGLTDIRRFMEEGDVASACTELWRLARLGSGDAAAVMGFLMFSQPGIAPLSAADAEEACRRAANGGNGYAQFVLALMEKDRGHHTQAVEWLGKACQRRFVAAYYESACIIYGRRRDMAFSLLVKGVKAWHFPSMLRFASLSIRGGFGLRWILPSILMLPAVVLTHLLANTYFPFSERVFIKSAVLLARARARSSPSAT
jgi:TPR repeat protein